ncbi:response regulator [Deferrisoma camini]|uniref:response regulator n=1 Tax=Deferrisoma camini TaxID=1035120 RepID=UPI00046CD415|nr:response regulator [Deferrisoma camini]
MARILIVDDEEHIRTLYTLELEDEGHEVYALESGRNIVEHVESFRPDVVILDIKMVDVSGLDVLQEIRNRFYDLPVILCSAYGSYKGDIKSVAADYYVVKSSDLTELKRKIEQALEARIPQD